MSLNGVSPFAGLAVGGPVLFFRCSPSGAPFSPTKSEDRQERRHDKYSDLVDSAEMADDHHSDSFQISGSRVPGSRPTSAKSRTDSVTWARERSVRPA